MDGGVFDAVVQRALASASRRGAVRAGVGVLAAAIAAAFGIGSGEEAEAKKRRKKGKKKRKQNNPSPSLTPPILLPLPSEPPPPDPPPPGSGPCPPGTYACPGADCLRSDQCCAHSQCSADGSGRICRWSDHRCVCPPESDCGNECCLPEAGCGCHTTREGAKFCGDLGFWACAPCDTDADCVALGYGPGAGCVQDVFGCDSETNPAGTVCAQKCGATCSPPGYGCDVTGDCCAGLCNIVEHRCCSPAGTPCLLGADCCSGNCQAGACA